MRAEGSPSSRRRRLALASTLALAAAGFAVLLLARDRRGAQGGGEPLRDAARGEDAPTMEGGTLRAQGGGRAASAARPAPAAPSAEVPRPASVPGSIVGVLLDPEGRPVSGATVRFLTAGPSEGVETNPVTFVEEGTAVTRPDGTFASRLIADPSVGPWPLCVMADGDRVMRSDPVRATTGGPAVVLRLVRREIARVRVLDPAGRPVGGASLQLHAALGVPGGSWGNAPAGTTQEQVMQERDLRRLSANTDATGVATLALGAPEAACALFASPPRDRDDIATLWISPWTPAETTVTLPPALVIEGRVQDADGAPVVAGSVEARLPSGEWTRAELQYDGTFQFGVLPAGPIPLRFRPDTFEGRWTGSDGPALPSDKIVAAGSRDVVLVANLGAELALRVEGWPREPGGTAILTPEGVEPANVGDGVAAMLHEITAEIGLDGTARLRGLDPATTYTLWVPPWIDGLKSGTADAPARRIAYRTKVRAADSPLSVALTEGAYVHGRLLRKGEDLSPKEKYYGAAVEVASHGVRLAGWVTPDGAFGIAGLPPGAWPTRIEARTAVFDGASGAVRYWSAAPMLSTENPSVDVALEPGPDPYAVAPSGR